MTVNLGRGTASGGHAERDSLSNIEHLRGSSHGDILTGGGGNTWLDGGGGRDTLWGGGGGDDLRGGTGDDELYGEADHDWLVGGAGGDYLDGGPGTDTASYVGSDAGVTVSLEPGATGTYGHAAGDTFHDVENLSGSSHDDTLTGNRLSNTLHGLGGADTLSGGGGNDWLVGGAGGDTLDGGPGEDTLSYVGSDASVEVDLERETARNAAGEGHAAGDRIRGFENVVGSKHNDDLRGSGESNELSGGDGVDVLTGRGGADTLWGGPGADTFVFFAAADSTSDARDVIKDFSSSAGDRIDLRDLLESGGTFTRTAPFAGVAGEVRYTQQTVSGTAWTDVFVDVNGNGAADLVVRLEGTYDLDASDFLLTN